MSVDCEEIVALLIRYGRAIDAKGRKLLRSCFTDEATCDYSAIGS
jgi:hypothetical protein